MVELKLPTQPIDKPYIQHSPPLECWDRRSAGYTGGRVSISPRVLRIPGRVFFKFDMGKVVNIIVIVIISG